MEITKLSKNNGLLVMKEISYDLAKDMMIKNHYSKKWNSGFGKINIGIFRDNTLLGCAVFGNLMNPKSYKTLLKDGEEGSVIELNRLWIDDILGMNTETILISSSFKLIKALYPKVKLVQSFADGRLGCGTIYKASNFKYFGYTNSLFFKDKATGEVFHKVPLENTKSPKGFLNKNRRYLDKELQPFYVKTYRYLYPLYKKTTVLLAEKPYPAYDKGYKNIVYSHSLPLLCRLSLMFLEVSDEEYYLKCLNHIKELGFSKEDREIQTENQKSNESYIWFRNSYLGKTKNKNAVRNQKDQSSWIEEFC